MRGRASSRRAASSASGCERERPAAADLAQHDPAAVERERERVQARADLVLLDAQGVRELLGRHGVRREEEQRLELALDAHATAAAIEPPVSARTVIGPERLVLLPGGLAALVELEQREHGDRDRHPVGARDGLVEGERPAAQQAAEHGEALGEPDARHRDVLQVDRRRRAQQPAERLAEHGRVVGLLGVLERRAAQVRGQRRRAVEHRLLDLAARGEVAARAAEARVGEHALEQLLGGLGRGELVELLDLLARAASAAT